jgi:hypothetical protein
MRDVIIKRKSLSHDGQQFHQYKKNTSHLKITDYNKDHDIKRWKSRYWLGTGKTILLLI